MNRQASGTFSVNLAPQAPDASALGRLTIDKTFQGDLEGTSQGQMLAASTATPGSAGYVALERVTGTLDGRSGTFVLQHSGVMNRGQALLSVTVVPDSGTGQLTGLSGTMTIAIVDKEHRYGFEYSFGAEG
jgi:Flp pilus assembly protein TadG